MPSQTKVHFEDLTVKNRYLTCKVALSRFNPKFKEAQRWLDQTTMQYMIPIILIGGKAFFVAYDYCMYKWRFAVNNLVARIIRK